MSAARGIDRYRAAHAGDAENPDGLFELEDTAASADTVVITDVDRHIRLVPSVEQSVVFSSLAAQCVPELCDQCTIDIVDGVRARYRIVYPPLPEGSGSLLRLADQAAAGFNGESDDARAHFHGSATFVWHRRNATRIDRTIAALLVDQAVQLVVLERSEQHVRAATSKAHQLETVLPDESSHRHGRRHPDEPAQTDSRRGHRVAAADQPTPQSLAVRSRARRDRHRVARPGPAVLAR